MASTEATARLKFMPDFEGKPIRMRGFHRAVKNSQSPWHAWAKNIWDKKARNELAYLFALTYRNIDFKSIFQSPWPIIFKDEE